MKHIFRYCAKHSKELVDQLSQVGIHHSVTDERMINAGLGLVVFYLSEEDLNLSSVKQVIEALDTFTVYDELVYTEKELSAAKWLYIRSTCMKVEPPNNSSSVVWCPGEAGSKCYIRSINLPIMSTKPVKWGKNHYFYSAFELGYNELFCSEKTVEILKELKLPLSYIPVIHEKTGNEIPDLYYIKPNNVLPLEAIDFSQLRIQSSCRKCGQITYELSGRDQLCIFEDYLNPHNKVYAAPCVFGPLGAESAIIISQDVYKYLKQNKMLRSMSVTPVAARAEKL